MGSNCDLVSRRNQLCSEVSGLWLLWILWLTGGAVGLWYDTGIRTHPVLIEVTQQWDTSLLSEFREQEAQS